MKYRTNPKTTQTSTELAAADLTAFAKVIDCLINTERVEGDTSLGMTAQYLKEFVDTRRAKTKDEKEAESQPLFDSKKE